MLPDEAGSRTPALRSVSALGTQVGMNPFCQEQSLVYGKNLKGKAWTESILGPRLYWEKTESESDAAARLQILLEPALGPPAPVFMRQRLPL